MFICFVTEGYPAEKAVSFTEAVRLALEDNHEVRALRNALSATKADVGIARSYLLPKMGFEERAFRTNNPTEVFSTKLNQQRFSQADFAINKLNNPDAVGDFQTLFSFEQPVFAPTSLVGLGMARKEYSAKSDEYQRKREEICFSVAQAYLRVHTALEHQRVTGKGLEDAREHLRIAEIRYKNGLAQYSDVLRARTSLAESEQRVVSANKDVSVAKNWLGLLLGIDGPVDVNDAVLEFPLMDIEHYISSSLSRRDVKALEIRHQVARDGVIRANSLYLPVIGVGASYQMNDHNRALGSEGDSWRLMAVLRWDVFDGAGREFEKKKAQDKAAETMEHLNGLRRLVSFRIHEAYLGIEEARKNVDFATAAVATAEEGRKLVKTRYENSLSPIVDLLDVQVSLDRARESLVSRKNEYQIAILNLGYEGGTILRDLNIEQ